MKSIGVVLSSVAASAVAQTMSSMMMPAASNMPNMNLPGLTATANTSSSTACADVHIIVVRASTELPSQGIIGTLATRISGANPGSTVEWIRYPALLNPYQTSSEAGTREATARLMNYADTCKNSKIVLLGYSQGAHIVGDIMCGGGEGPGLGAFTPPVASMYSDRVAAVVQMGDPRHVVNKTFDTGTATMNGIFPRPNDISCDKFAKKFKAFCDADDPFCSQGQDLLVHLTYTSRYNDQAMMFVQDRLKAKDTVMSSAPKLSIGMWSSLAMASFGAIMVLAF